MELLFGFIMLCFAIHGLILSFRASIILGIIMLFFLPIAAIFSLIKLLAKTDIPALIVEKLFNDQKTKE